MSEQEKNEDYILLKWGTLKGWRITNPTALEFLQQWGDLGVSFSAIAQKNTPEQKELLCELIRNHDGSITNDWSGEEYTQDQAIDYIMNYGRGRS